MKEMVNKFLDEYLGNEFKCSTDKYNYHYIYSKKNNMTIFFFRVFPEDRMTIFRGEALNQLICSFFLIEPDDAMKYVRSWFGDRQNIIKTKDLLTYVENS